MPIPVFCADCGARGVIAKLSTDLMCRCGSSNLGLEGVDPKPSMMAQGAGGTGWGKPMPSPTRGWSDYAGPLPGTPPRAPRDMDTHVCPQCHGTGLDPAYPETVCRRCMGAGTVTGIATGPPGNDYLHPETMDATEPSGPPSGGARWQGRAAKTERPARQVTLPAPDERRYLLAQANCPSCANHGTALAPDRAHHAWWVCKCGSLADLDRHPDLDPYRPGENFRPDRSMKTRTAKLARKPRRDGRLLAILTRVHAANQVSAQEALTLARATLVAHGG
jgi:hypothetical protein